MKSVDPSNFGGLIRSGTLTPLSGFNELSCLCSASIVASNRTNLSELVSRPFKSSGIICEFTGSKVFFLVVNGVFLVGVRGFLYFVFAIVDDLCFRKLGLLDGVVVGFVDD